MDADQLVSFVLDKKWLALAILVIGYITRLLSDESKFPVSVPARWRPVITVVLGQALGALMMIQGGASWKVAVLTGLAVSFATMGLFDLLVKAVFNGAPPWFIDIFALVFPPKNVAPKPPKLPTGLGTMMLGLFLLFVAACGAFGKAVERAIVDDVSCALSKIDMPDEIIVRDCFDKLSPEEKAKGLKVVHDQRALQAKLTTEAHVRGFDEAKAKLSCGGAK